MLKNFKVALLAAASVAAVATASVAHADTYDRHVMLINESHATIREFYASNVGTDDWQEDVLGRFRLLPNHYARLNLDDGTGYCRFDFKTVFDDGTYIIRRNVDVCTLERYRITG